MSDEYIKLKDPHENMPQLSRLVFIGEDKKRGRFIEAAEDIPPGTVICNEVGITLGINPERCTYCLKSKGNSSKIYCSACVDVDSQYDKYEGPFRQELDNLGMVGLCIRVLLSYSPETLENHFIHNKHPENCPFSKTFELKKSDCPDDFRPIDIFLNKFENHLKETKEWKTAPNGLFRIGFEELFSRLKLNGHVVHSLCCTKDIPEGTGLFPISSVINHSCKANVFSFFHNNQFIWVSMGIRKGHEILDSYGVQAHSTDFEERKTYLAGRGFSCNCRICEEGSDDTLLIAPENLKLPERLSHAEIMEIIKKKLLPMDHAAFSYYLEENIFQGAPDCIECFELLQQNQSSRGMIFDPIMITQYLAMIDLFKDSKIHKKQVDDWLLCVLFLMQMYCRTLHPRFEEMQVLWQRRC